MNDTPVGCQNREWTEPQRDSSHRVRRNSLSQMLRICQLPQRGSLRSILPRCAVVGNGFIRSVNGMHKCILYGGYPKSVQHRRGRLHIRPNDYPSVCGMAADTSPDKGRQERWYLLKRACSITVGGIGLRVSAGRFFVRRRQKAQEILDVFPRIFDSFGGKSTAESRKQDGNGGYKTKKWPVLADRPLVQSSS